MQHQQHQQNGIWHCNTCRALPNLIARVKEALNHFESDVSIMMTSMLSANLDSSKTIKETLRECKELRKENVLLRKHLASLSE